jgi:uncharacterized protein GlcG (DUF336 family)
VTDRIGSGVSSSRRWRAPSGKRQGVARAALAGVGLAVLLTGCGGGAGGEGASDAGCDGTCAQRALEASEVRTIVAQAVAEAEALGVSATIAVVDRVGNLLALFAMDGAAANTVITSGRGVSGGLEELVVPAALAAMSKAGTGAYLSSQGNAFTTRTASQIVQENFNPGERGRPGGPLFGVQFSQLACGDLVRRFNPDRADDRAGPHAMPLGLSADPGGIPLYKASSGVGIEGRVPVGGIGVEIGCGALAACDVCTPRSGEACLPQQSGTGTCDGTLESVYGLDRRINDLDVHLEERIAVAAAVGFEAPANRRADRIALDGKFARYVDDDRISGAAAAPCEALAGDFVVVPGFGGAESCAALRGGEVVGAPSSGLRNTTFEGLPAVVLVDADGNERFPVRDGDHLSADEVRAVLRNGLEIVARTRAQIRRPLGSPAQVSLVVVGTKGEVLGIVRSRDAPVFGIDVALQKARTATFFSSAGARAALENAGGDVAAYVGKVEAFLVENGRFDGRPITADQVLTGGVAFADRSGGNLSRPFFPDGINGNPGGPFSHDFAEWSPFKTGLQFDLVFPGIADAVCAGNRPTACTAVPALPNGIQIFPGSVPIYRGAMLIGGIGVSGDGVDQDDLIAFLAVDRAGRELGTLGNAPPEIRADNISVDGAHLRFVNCPVKPFIDSDVQGVCDGL